MRIIFGLILTVFALTTSFAQKTDLALNLEPGKEYRQTTDSKGTIIQEVSGQKINMEMSLKGSIVFLVKSTTNTDYEMDARFESIGMAMKLPQGTMEFSSEKKDENDVFSRILSAMIGKKFQLIMHRTGKVKEVSNVEALWEDAINQFDEVPAMQKEQIKAQIMRAYGAEALKGSIESVTAIYPEKPVNKGDKWNIETNLESGMAAIKSTDYEFSELTSEHALIKGLSTIVTEDKDAYVETNGVPMKYDMTGTMLSEIKVDRNTGWILEATINQEISGDAYIKENPQMPNGMKIPMTLLNEMVITN